MGKQEEIRERVMDIVEALTVGQAIPAERRLCELLGVSRLTVRAALDELVAEGYLTRRHGSGTYVSEDGEPMALEVLHVPAAMVPDLTEADLENASFYDLLQDRYGVTIVSGTQTIEPTVTNEEESEALGVPLHSPAFLFERTTLAQSGQPIEFVRSFYRGDRYRLVTELLPRRGRNGRVGLQEARSLPIVLEGRSGRSDSNQ